ncbi:MAG: ATP-dependent zinc metalloprotease FtsH [Patescibacteria group bacterium]
MKISPKKDKKFEFKLKFNLWKIGFVALGILIFAPLFLGLIQTRVDDGQIELSQAVNDIKEQKIEKISIEGDKLLLFYKGDQIPKITTKEANISFTELLERSGIDPRTVKYTVSDQSVTKAFGEVAGFMLPLAITGVVILFIMRSQNKGAMDIFSFGKSRAKLFSKGKQSVTFADVAGVDEAKRELEEVVDFLKNPGKYRAIGARTPKGVLLFGQAGVGKTLLAKAVAGEAGVPFFSMAGSEFMEMLVGIGASRVRDLFGQAKAAAPSIIFIDEIDAIGRQRGKGFIGGHDEREQTLNQILVEMDGFTPNDNVMVIAATNRGDLLDPALLRPGRFDRRVTLDMPDKEGRLDILKIHAKGKTFAKSVNWGRVADRTVGFSGADLENMLNEAAILAARASKKEIDMIEVEEAATKVKLGPAKKRLQSDEDKKITAYHEGGHAIVTNFLPKMDPVHRISIVARGMSLGHTLIPPAADRTHDTKSRLLDTITAMLGGRAAEDVIFNEMTSGASNDIEKATSLARAMVVDFGMSSLGPINYGNQTDYGEFGNPEMYEGAKVSQAMMEKIDVEIKKIIDTSYKEAIALIRKYKKDLDKVAAALLDKETLDRDEFEKIVGKK